MLIFDLIFIFVNLWAHDSWKKLFLNAWHIYKIVRSNITNKKDWWQLLVEFFHCQFLLEFSLNIFGEKVLCTWMHVILWQWKMCQWLPISCWFWKKKLWVHKLHGADFFPRRILMIDLLFVKTELNDQIVLNLLYQGKETLTQDAQLFMKIFHYI